MCGRQAQDSSIRNAFQVECAAQRPIQPLAEGTHEKFCARTECGCGGDLTLPRSHVRIRSSSNGIASSAWRILKMCTADTRSSRGARRFWCVFERRTFDKSDADVLDREIWRGTACVKGLPWGGPYATAYLGAVER